MGILSVSKYGVTMAVNMETIFTGIALGTLIIMQWFIIWECIRMKATVGEHSTDLKSEMGNLGTLLDEALDFLADNINSPPSLLSTPIGNTQSSPDLKDMILSAFMSKIAMPFDHGSEKEPEVRQIQQDEQTQNDQNEVQDW